MGIQIFGSAKSFNTKKAERYFKERRIPYQLVNLEKQGISKGELRSVRAVVGSYESMTDFEGREDAALLRYLSSEEAKLEKLFENPRWLKTPIVRSGKEAAVGYCPEVWKSWEG